MSENEFPEAVSAIMYVAWAAATGQLEDVSSFWKEERTSRSGLHQNVGVVLAKVLRKASRVLSALLSLYHYGTIVQLSQHVVPTLSTRLVIPHLRQTAFILLLVYVHVSSIISLHEAERVDLMSIRNGRNMLGD